MVICVADIDDVMGYLMVCLMFTFICLLWFVIIASAIELGAFI